MRRFLAAAGAAALGLAVVAPVAARAAMPDNGHQLSFYQPVTYDRMTGNKTNLPATANDGDAVYSTDEVVTVAADFRNSGDGIKSWDVVLRPVNGGTPSTCHENEALRNGVYPGIVYINCPWDTTRAVDRTHDATNTDPVDSQNYDRNWHLNDHGPSVNGKYSIEVTVTNSGVAGGLITQSIPGDQQFTLYEPNTNPPRWRQVWVNNDVAAPTGINAAYDPGSARINVTWAPNPEPDVTYLVQEKVGDGKWGNPITVPGTATNYTRAVDQPGKYQYQVAAQRPGPTADSGGGATAVKKSAYVASSVVSVDQVTPPTTAAGPNGADGSIDHSGDNGVFLPTDASPTTAGNAPAGASAKGGGSGGAPRPGATGGVTRPSGPAARANGSAASGGGGEAEGEGPDEGFSSTLPFTQQDGSADGLGDGSEDPETMGPNFVKVPKPQDARSVLIPMAGALVVFMLAMQLMVWARRRPATLAASGDDFDDWMSY